jgi:signal transduction histidine kinase
MKLKIISILLLIQYVSASAQKEPKLLSGHATVIEFIYNHSFSFFQGHERLNWIRAFVCQNKSEVTWKCYHSLAEVIGIPVWYSTWWLVLIMALIIAYFLILTYKNRFHGAKKQQRLEEMVYKRTFELEETNIALQEKQDEINKQKEELEKQRNAVQSTNELLMEQQKKIIEQNKELDKHRNELESIVSERTRELEEAKKKAEESDKLKSSFLANMSHEIRTPMNSILGFSNLLSDESLSKENRKSFVDIIIRCGESLIVLIDDILDISKIQAGQLILNYNTILIENILNELYDTFTIEAQKYNLEIKINNYSPSENLWIDTDAIRLRQIFSNLIINSIKYTDAGFIEFGIKEQDNNKVIFYVKDTGIGIPEEIGNAVFENFMKVEDKHTKAFSGVGLGLTISKSLINLMGGDIWYISKKNEGTTFYFSLPLGKAKEKAKRIVQTASPSSHIPSLSDKTILVAEDEENNFKLLATLLKKTKANILWAKNGLEAVNMCQQNPSIDLILMDIKMPKMNGIEANKKIKAIRKDIMVVAQTAFAYEHDINEFLSSGFDSSITKPIKIKELMNILVQFLGH